MGGSSDGDGGMMATLVCLGFGYCARHYMAHFGDRFTRVVGTTRTAGNAATLAASPFGNGRVDMMVFDGEHASPDVAAAVAGADALLISAAPGESGDPVLAAFGDHIAAARGLRSIVVLSTLGVYSDSGGAWIDETAPVVPERARRGRARIDAERAWQALGAQCGVPVAILRLGGIYGPGQNGMLRVLRGVAHCVAKPGHVSNRIHVFDIAQAIDAAFARHADGIFNVVDDEPASPSAQVAFAADLLGVAPPPEIPYAEAARVLTPFALSFYDGCIRARNDKLKAELGVTLRYPNYRDGLRALHAAGDHLVE
jgi:nucleoside-diphosphate-sugar epimerase